MPLEALGALGTTEFQTLTQQYPLLQMGTTELDILKMSIIEEGILYLKKLDEERWSRSDLRGPSSWPNGYPTAMPHPSPALVYPLLLPVLH